MSGMTSCVRCLRSHNNGFMKRDGTQGNVYQDGGTTNLIELILGSLNSCAVIPSSAFQESVEVLTELVWMSFYDPYLLI